EYVEVLRELWATGKSDLKGEFFQMNDCQVKPQPQADMKIICAGQSDAGLAFSAKYADYNFVFGKGVNTPTAYAEINDRLKAQTDKTGRNVQTYVLFMVIAAETDEAAMQKWQHYNDGADMEAIRWLQDQGAKDKVSGTDTNIRHMASSVSPVNINMGTIVGSFKNVAKMLDQISEIKGTEGILLTFDDFLQGVEDFGQRIQPLMKCRESVVTEICNKVLRKGLPAGTGLNVNIPVVGSLSGIKVCRAARGHWTEEYDKRTDPAGHNYYWLTGHFHNMEPECEDTDEYLLSRGIATVVPVLGDRTGFHQIGMIDSLLHD
ncbi:MAG: LLM class flavin-dependent oxidoreductase, partial [Bacteroidales bacterium]|nr:LLM class flavin-dependent oxidoreductase [Bacteroidales bacterium]